MEKNISVKVSAPVVIVAVCVSAGILLRAFEVVDYKWEYILLPLYVPPLFMLLLMMMQGFYDILLMLLKKK